MYKIKRVGNGSHQFLKAFNVVCNISREMFEAEYTSDASESRVFQSKEQALKIMGMLSAAFPTVKFTLSSEEYVIKDYISGRYIESFYTENSGYRNPTFNTVWTRDLRKALKLSKNEVGQNLLELVKAANKTTECVLDLVTS